jgi:hypothetical protein
MAVGFEPKKPSAFLCAWLATSAAFFISWLMGFSFGRYVVLLPLLLTAIALSRGRSFVLVGLAISAALGVWWVFSFALFGRVLLQTGFLIEFLLCSALYLVATVWSFSRKQERNSQ